MVRIWGNPGIRYVGRMVAEQTGVSQDEAQTRVAGAGHRKGCQGQEGETRPAAEKSGDFDPPPPRA